MSNELSPMVAGHTGHKLEAVSLNNSYNLTFHVKGELLARVSETGEVTLNRDLIREFAAQPRPNSPTGLDDGGLLVWMFARLLNAAMEA